MMTALFAASFPPVIGYSTIVTMSGMRKEKDGSTLLIAFYLTARDSFVSCFVWTSRICVWLCGRIPHSLFVCVVRLDCMLLLLQEVVQSACPETHDQKQESKGGGQDRGEERIQSKKKERCLQDIDVFLQASLTNEGNIHQQQRNSCCF